MEQPLRCDWGRGSFFVGPDRDLSSASVNDSAYTEARCRPGPAHPGWHVALDYIRIALSTREQARLTCSATRKAAREAAQG
jgi:hypothetical protein